MILPPGTYSLTGTNNGSNYNLTGTVSGTPITVTGKIPTATTAGSYSISRGSDSMEGGILPVGSPRPSIRMTDAEVGPLEPGAATNLGANPTNFPSGTIEYRWFIAGAAAYYINNVGTAVQGQDIRTPSRIVNLQTTLQDTGALFAYVQAFSVAPDGVQTFLAQAFTRVGLLDIQFDIATWVIETATNPNDGQVTTSFWKDFPTVPGANRYIVNFLNLSGQVTASYRILQSDIDNTPITGIPVYVGRQPHSFPPKITVTELTRGVIRHNFIRRGSSVRVLMVITTPAENPEQFNLPVTIKIYK